MTNLVNAHAIFFVNTFVILHFVEPKNKIKIKKTGIYQNPEEVKLDNYFCDANFTKLLRINGQKILVIGLDTCVARIDNGFVEEEVLHALSDIIDTTPHDRIFMLTHHSVLTTDFDPLVNSRIVTNFMLKHKIEASFCGHTHDVDIVEIKDIIRGGGFRQFRCGSMSSRTIIYEPNMYCTYENFGAKNEKITIVRMHAEGENIRFEETVV